LKRVREHYFEGNEHPMVKASLIIDSFGGNIALKAKFSWNNNDLNSRKNELITAIKIKK